MHDEKVQPVVGNSIGHLSTGPKLHLNTSQASLLGSLSAFPWFKVTCNSLAAVLQATWMWL